MEKFIRGHKKSDLFFRILIIAIYLIISYILITKYNITGILIYFILSMLISIVSKNYTNKKKQDEIKSLVMEIQKKDMEIAELQLEREKQNN